MMVQTHAKRRKTLSPTYALPLVILLAALSVIGQADRSGRVHLTILSTTDLHGNIYPIDYYSEKAEPWGLAKVATVVRQIRKENANVLLLDSGDTTQGTPLEYYHNRRDNQPPDPMMLVMNMLGYDAMTVGNHDFNFGLQVQDKARREAKFPWLSANTYEKGTDRPHYAPYLIKEIAGVRVGVLGLTTPGVPNWDNAENYAGLEFREPVSEARRWVAVLREKEKADVVVVAMHMGLEEDLKTGQLNPGQVPDENRALAIARQVPGIDVILMGHTHRDVPSLVVNGVLLTQASYWGRQLARVDLFLNQEAGGRWRIAAESAWTIPMDDRVAPDPEALGLAASYHQATEAWLTRAIGQSDAELTARDARFRDSAILDLIQRVQLDAGHADVSMAASFNPQARIPRGPVTVREIAGLYTYENTLVVLEVTGQQLKDALEHSARYFGLYEAGKSPAELVDSKIPAYNFDVAEGVTYDLDLTKPLGARIQNLRFRGQPLQPEQRLRLATNNYRVNGGGGYSMYKGAKVVYRSSEEIRDLIIDWVEQHKNIPTAATNNWRIEP
jgi:2',3'-cyclic-nucleotide 2'-phosphodiesterase / 3'-nucleotidase